MTPVNNVTAPGRVLVVDDDAFARTFLTDVLHPDFHQVLTASTGAEALERVVSFHPEVVLLDLVLPDMPGLAVLERMQGLDPGLAIVCVTGVRDADTVVGALRGRAFDYLAKPVVPAVLRRTVERALQTRRLLGENKELRRALELSTLGQRVLSAPDIIQVCQALLESLVSLVGATVGVMGADTVVTAQVGLTPQAAQDRLAALGHPLPMADVTALEGTGANLLRLQLGEARAHGAVWSSVPFGPTDVEAARFLLANATTALQHHVRFAEARDAARRDHLTGLLNATVLEEGLAQCLARAAPDHGVVGLVFMDLDQFKQVNDAYGHLAGSRTLVELAGLLTRSVRGEDLLCRFGGDEYVVVLPDTTPQHARAVAERLRSSIQRHRFLLREGRSVQVTASVGLALAPSDATTARALLLKADAAMYEAKRRGKNQVVCADGSGTQAPVT